MDCLPTQFFLHLILDKIHNWLLHRIFEILYVPLNVKWLLNLILNEIIFNIFWKWIRIKHLKKQIMWYLSYNCLKNVIRTNYRNTFNLILPQSPPMMWSTRVTEPQTHSGSVSSVSTVASQPLVPRGGTVAPKQHAQHSPQSEGMGRGL